MWDDNAPAKLKAQKPWIGVDLDGTLARYDGWKHLFHVGEPVVPMVERVKQWLSEGKCVKIMTARITPPYFLPDRDKDQGITEDDVRRVIQDWTEKHIGERLEVTATKDLHMVELWDDRAVQVEPNTGEPTTYWVSRA